MELKSEPMIFTRDELQLLTNCVTFELYNDYGDFGFKDKLEMQIKLNEQLDRLTVLAGE